MCIHLIVTSSICKISMKNNKQNKVFITMYLYYLLCVFILFITYSISHKKIITCSITHKITMLYCRLCITLQKIGTKYLFKYVFALKKIKI